MKMPAAKGWLLSLILSLCFAVAVGSPYLQLSSTGSLVHGASVNFSAFLWEHYPDKPGVAADYIYHWSDNADPPHEWKDRTRNHFSNWSIEYPVNTTKPGTYRVVCEVERYFVFWFTLATNHVDYVVTQDITGEMQLIQDGRIIGTQWVSTTSPVNHSLTMRANDIHYLLTKATDVNIYWFQNCSYLGMSNSLSYEALYADEGDLADIEAVLVASFEKIPDPIPSTTTTTTTTKPTTTTTTTSTTSKPTTQTTPTTRKKPESKIRSKREVNDNTSIAVNQTVEANAAILGVNLTSFNTSVGFDETREPLFHHKRVLQESLQRPSPPYDCKNKKYIAHDPQKAYGYYKRRVVSINPINNFTVNGKNWLQHGELVNLDINCKGTAPIEQCILVFNAPYNATGNETCKYFYKENNCKIKFIRYFSESKTVLFFIRNPVSTTVNQVTIKIYEAKRASQLSVVVVPVSFSLIAVICVVFGVAYYVQGRNRFTVEVADFNFGETQSLDMEYKTFSQRLFDSICEIIPRRRRRFSQSSSDNGEPESPIGVTHTAGVNSNLRYDSMT